MNETGFSDLKNNFMKSRHSLACLFVVNYKSHWNARTIVHKRTLVAAYTCVVMTETSFVFKGTLNVNVCLDCFPNNQDSFV